MPIFSGAAEQIRAIAYSDKAAVSDLAESILRDPGMTTKLLRISNSVAFNTSGEPIATVSRAIVMLGFDKVQEVVSTVASVDTLLHGPARERVLRQMTRSFHAAVQARWLAVKRFDEEPEEVFIASLLYHFGELAFWHFAGDVGGAIDQAQKADPQRAGEIEYEMLGFRLRQLTVALAGEWRICPLLRSALKGSHVRQSREEGIVIAHRLAESLENGWDSELARERMKEVGKYLNVPVEAIAGEIVDNAIDSARIAAEFSATTAAALSS